MSVTSSNYSNLALPAMFLDTLTEPAVQETMGPFTKDQGHGFILTYIVSSEDQSELRPFPVVIPQTGESKYIMGVEVRQSKDLRGRKVIGLSVKKRSMQTRGDNEFAQKAYMIDSCLKQNSQWLEKLDRSERNNLFLVCKDINRRIERSKKTDYTWINTDSILDSEKSRSVTSTSVPSYRKDPESRFTRHQFDVSTVAKFVDSLVAYRQDKMPHTLGNIDQFDQYIAQLRKKTPEERKELFDRARKSIDGNADQLAVLTRLEALLPNS